MVQRTVVTRTCDLEHAGETEGTETLSFALNGQAYEVDACEKHASEARGFFAHLVEHARKASGMSKGRHRAPSAGGRGPGREYARRVREWAKASGIHVSERGALPEDVKRQYEASQGVARKLAAIAPAGEPPATEPPAASNGHGSEPSPSLTGSRREIIRAWAQEHPEALPDGVKVKARGILPRAVVEAYETAQQAPRGRGGRRRATAGASK